MWLPPSRRSHDNSRPDKVSETLMKACLQAQINTLKGNFLIILGWIHKLLTNRQYLSWFENGMPGTCENIGLMWFLSWSSLVSPFSTTLGKDSSRRVWPVGAVSKITTEKFIFLTSLKKGRFLYSAVSSPLDRSKRFTLFALPGRPVHSDTNSASPGCILAKQQVRAKTKSLTFPPLYSHVLIYTAESTGASMERTKMPNLRNGSKGDSNPGSLDCESGNLPLSYNVTMVMYTTCWR